MAKAGVSVFSSTTHKGRLWRTAATRSWAALDAAGMPQALHSGAELIT
jgi:hypothetical protein